MYGCMDGWMYGCMSVYVCICLYMSVYVCICLCMSVYVCICLYMSVCLSVCQSVSLSVCLYVRAYVCMYVYVCVCICDYISSINHRVIGITFTSLAILFWGSTYHVSDINPVGASSTSNIFINLGLSPNPRNT